MRRVATSLAVGFSNVLRAIRCVLAGCFGIGIKSTKASRDGISTAVTLFGSVISLTVALLVAIRASANTLDDAISQRYLAVYVVTALLPVFAMFYFVRARSMKRGRTFDEVTVKFYYWSIPISIVLISAVTVYGIDNRLPGQPSRVFQVADVENYESESGEHAIKVFVYVNQSIYQGPLPKAIPLKINLPAEMSGHWEFGSIDLYELNPGATPHEKRILPGGYTYQDDPQSARVAGLKPDGAYRIDLILYPIDESVPRDRATRLLINTRSGIRIAQEAMVEDKSP